MFKEIMYSKVFNLGDYENEKIGVVMSIAEGEDPRKVIDDAKAYVELSSSRGREKIEKAQAIVANPSHYTGIAVGNAKKILGMAERLNVLPSLNAAAEATE